MNIWHPSIYSFIFLVSTKIKWMQLDYSVNYYEDSKMESYGYITIDEGLY